MSLLDLLTRRHGQPERGRDDDTGLATLRFLPEGDPRGALLQLADHPAAPDPLRALYGPIHGGFLAGDALKLGTLTGPEVYGLYSLQEYATLEDVEPFTAELPGLTVFMDAANVFYLGVREGRVWQYDIETGEITDRGPVMDALSELLDEWETAL
jgi:hypothetical protein